MRFRDALEEAGGLERAALEAKVAAERARLLAEAERAAAAPERGAGEREARSGSARGARCGPA